MVFGTSMLGYRVREGKLTIEPEGAEIVRLIFHKYGVEKKGTGTIVRELREAGADVVFSGHTHRGQRGTSADMEFCHGEGSRQHPKTYTC